jgi:2-polyprenyl-3-methyl-5-hydroxy-6-metoxy-1,4-benzoquinol methylase
VATRQNPARFDHFADDLKRFEAAVQAQQAVTPDHYDEEYFATDWRDDDNRYELETRRRVEGRNPQLIRETFAPQRVLDVGCGPGFLMLFLQELGIETRGVDFSPASLDLAPAGIRDRIAIGDVSEPHVPAGSFDLVVCREVLEHLTVVQIARTVEQLARASSRYVYVTTRFHPSPSALLDFTTDFETDPTHVTLLTKDFLRCLFVVQGMRSRPDLEERLDWAGKGRVLVYEWPH